MLCISVIHVYVLFYLGYVCMYVCILLRLLHVLQHNLKGTMCPLSSGHIDCHVRGHETVYSSSILVKEF